MPVLLYTGTPGAGKTLGALEHCCKLMGVDANQEPEALAASIKAQTKINLVVVGVEGIREDLFQVEDDPYNWAEYPDGTVFLVDEAWKWFGSHNLEVKKDPRVLTLAEHRHRGMSFILTCQYPGQLIPHLRALVDEHIHVRRKFGTEFTVRYRWPHLVDSPNQIGAMKDAEESSWAYPRSVFSLYKSATIHTIKKRIPRKIWWMCAALVVVLGAGIWAAASMFGLMDRWKKEVPASAQTGPVSAQGAEPAATATTGRNGTQPQEVQTPVDWLLKHAPRVQGVPVSAPIYDDLRPVTYPRLACVIVGERETSRDCRCFTQQATAVTITFDLCRSIVENGWFDPFLEAEPLHVNGIESDPEPPRPRPASPDSGPPKIETVPAARRVPVWWDREESGVSG